MIQKININNKMYDVIDEEEFKDKYNKFDLSTTAVICKENNIVYPVISKNAIKDSIGVYIDGPFIKYKSPIENIEMYDVSNILEINPSNMKEMIEQSEMIRDLENEILTSPDNIFLPKIYKDDEPELAGMKQAICDKHIDIDKYEPRIGGTFSNDKRIFTSKNKNSITLSKLKRIANALDIRVTLILEDKNSEVPNPMNNKITMELTGGDEDE